MRAVRRRTRTLERCGAAGRAAARGVRHGPRIAAFASAAPLVLAALAGSPAEALACSCIPVDRPSQARTASIIFIGTVDATPPAAEGAGPGGGRVTYRFRVKETLKGDATATRSVSTAGSPAACGAVFTPGERYLVFAHARDGELETNLCEVNVGGAEVDRIAAEVRRILAEGE